MLTFEFMLIMTLAVLLSSVLDHVLTHISPPLIQIALGLIIALAFPDVVDVTLDPELFLMLFIAPVLFNDAKLANKLGLWRNRTQILLLAIVLVIVIMLVVGFLVHALIPTVPLAAAMALGAALGPTDAVAVISLRAVTKLKPKEASLLQGEALINDASGVVGFQFAIVAAVYGGFSLLDTSVEFAIMFFGGIAMGLVVAWLANWIQNKVRDMGLDSTTFHVMLDVMLPFIIFALSEAIGVSGILAVVAAGLFISTLGNKDIGPTSARLGIVTSSVWSVITYALNGIVFVMLGLQLPDAMYAMITSASTDNTLLLLYVLYLTAIVVGTRFVWIYVVEKISSYKSPRQHPKQGRLRSVLTTTFGGPKGAVTLSVMFSTPLFLADGSAFPERSLLIFMACGVILVTLLLANFLLPVLAPVPKDQSASSLPESDDQVAAIKIEIYNNVIEQLLKTRNEDNSRAVHAVAMAYNERINRVRTESDIDSTDSVRLRLMVLSVQRDELLKIHKEGSASYVIVLKNFMRIARSQSLLTHRNGYGWVVLQSLRHLPSTIRVLLHNLGVLLGRLVGRTPKEGSYGVRPRLEMAAVDFLQKLYQSEDTTIPKETIREQLMTHRSASAELSTTQLNVTAYARTSLKMLEVQRYAYNLELDQVTHMLEEGKISRATAKRLRDNVFLMMVDLSEDV